VEQIYIMDDAIRYSPQFIGKAMAASGQKQSPEDTKSWLLATAKAWIFVEDKCDQPRA
jgi:hypothetical protein